MPIFEYKCKECRDVFRTLRRGDSAADVRCPECGTTEVLRLLSVTATTTSGAAPDACGVAAGNC